VSEEAGALTGEALDGGGRGAHRWQAGRAGSGERCGVGRAGGRGARGREGEGTQGCTWLG
jgi:hypothetical protein